MWIEGRIGYDIRSLPTSLVEIEGERHGHAGFEQSSKNAFYIMTYVWRKKWLTLFVILFNMRAVGRDHSAV